MAVVHDDDETLKQENLSTYRPCQNIFEEKCSYQNGNFS
jgi:hypothetical protein